MEQDEKSEKPKRKPKSYAAICGMVATSVSYTHLTLPTILLV